MGWLLFVIFIGGLMLIGGLLLRGHIASGKVQNPFGKSLFSQRTDRRVDIVEQANLDGRRRLVLIRRDNIEHLIMTGGPVDVVVETGIDTRAELRKSSKPARSAEGTVERFPASEPIERSPRPARQLA